MSLDLLCIADFDGRLEQVNPAWTDVLGYAEEDLRWRPLIELVHPDDRPATGLELARLAREGLDTHNFRNRYRHADGSYRWLEWNARVIPDERRLYAAGRDAGRLIEAEELVSAHAEELEATVRLRTQALNESRLEILRRLALAAEHHDDDSQEHSERVGRNAALIARELGLGDETVALIRHAAPLHDIGKIGVPDEILRKAGTLDPHERAAMEKHTLIGAEILAEPRFAILQTARLVALTHHEHWDGGGYPHGLRGREIPLSGRITAVADVFDALTHPRPYKPAWPLEEAVAEIGRLAHRQFDPAVAGAFAALDHRRLLDSPRHFDLTLPPPPLVTGLASPADLEHAPTR